MVPQPNPIVDIQHIVSDEKCYETVRKLRWPYGAKCPHCHATCITKYGRDETQPARQKYRCRKCGKRFDDLTRTIFSGHHQPLKVWILCLYFIGIKSFNLANFPRVGSE